MTDSKREWMLGLQGHNDLVALDEVVRLIHGGQLRATDMVKREGEPWRAASDVPELSGHFVGPEGRRATSRKLRPLGPPSRFRRRQEASLPVLPASRPEALESRYFSPSDLMRAMSYALAPRKLAVTALLLVPAVIAFSLLRYAASAHVGSFLLERAVIASAAAVVLFAATATALALALVTRRQIEGLRPGMLEVAGHLLKNARAAFVLPAGALIPAVVLFALLMAFGWGAGGIVTQILFAVPFVLSVLVVAVGVGFQIVLMTAPSALAVEHCPLSDALRSSFYYFRTQASRLLLHALLIAMIVLLAHQVCSRLLDFAYALPDWAASKVILAGGSGVVTAFYQGLRDGLALVVPVSIFATMSMLSYLVLRQEDMVYTTEPEGDLDETRVSEDDRKA